MTNEELAKDLGPVVVLTIGVGTMVGVDIFVLPREAYGIVGPAVVLLFVVVSVISLFTALSASELGTAMPKAGGSYYYINYTLGPFLGSIVGIGNWMGLAFALAFYIIGFGGFLVSVASVSAVSPGVAPLSSVQVAAILAGLLFIDVNYVSMKETGALQVVIAVTLAVTLTAFSIFDFLEADLMTLCPFALSELGGHGAVLPGTTLVFISSLSFAKITTVAEEIRNPGCNPPLAVVGPVVIVTTIYAILMIVMASVKPWQELSTAGANPVIEVVQLPFESVFGLGGLGVGLIILGGLLATVSSMNASILASSRINFAMGRDKLVTTWFNEIHPWFAIPYRSITVTGFIIVFSLVAVDDIKVLTKAGSVLHLIVYGFFNLALIVMRESDAPDYDPESTVPFYPITPILGAVFPFGLIAFFDPVEIGLSALFVVSGIIWYLFYARERADKRGILSWYVPSRSSEMPDVAVSAASTIQPDGGYRVTVPLSNPGSECGLVSLGGAVVKASGGTFVGVHIMKVPDQTVLESVREEYDFAEVDRLLEQARVDADELNMNIETHTVLPYRSFEEVFDVAETYNADLVVMNWGSNSHGSPGRAEGTVEEMTNALPYGVLVLKDRGFDSSNVLVPAIGGPGSDLSVSIASALREFCDVEAELLYVADDAVEGEHFLWEWADERDLGDAMLTVETGDVETAIELHATDVSLLVVGATERGPFSRLVGRTVVIDVVDDVGYLVPMAEQSRARSTRKRLPG